MEDSCIENMCMDMCISMCIEKGLYGRVHRSTWKIDKCARDVEYIRTCMDMCVDMFAEMCIDVCVDMYAWKKEKCRRNADPMWMCVDMCVDMFADTCIDVSVYLEDREVREACRSGARNKLRCVPNPDPKSCRGGEGSVGHRCRGGKGVPADSKAVAAVRWSWQ